MRYRKHCSPYTITPDNSQFLIIEQLSIIIQSERDTQNKLQFTKIFMPPLRNKPRLSAVSLSAIRSYELSTVHCQLSTKIIVNCQLLIVNSLPSPHPRQPLLQRGNTIIHHRRKYAQYHDACHHKVKLEYLPAVHYQIPETRF